MSLHVEGAVGDEKVVELHGFRPESNLIFTQKVLDIGAIPVGAPQKATAMIRNVGESDAMFQASPIRYWRRFNFYGITPLTLYVPGRWYHMNS